MNYGSPWARLTATADGESCWLGYSGAVCRYGYVRMNFWIPGLGRAVPLTSHVAAWVCSQLRPNAPWEVGANELYLAYLEFRCSGLELDHKCRNPACRNPSPDHLQPVTPKENSALRDQRRKLQDISPEEMEEVGF